MQKWWMAKVVWVNWMEIKRERVLERDNVIIPVTENAA